MKDKDFLLWIYARLINVYGEDKNIDYMLKLKAVINSIDSEKITPNI